MEGLKLGQVEVGWTFIFQIINTILIIVIACAIGYVIFKIPSLFRLPKMIKKRNEKIDMLEQKIDELEKKIGEK
ncbi:hypothetical protein R9X47_24495 [Wukongibacter baidiensis]|uniref:hypothetical protein n=1 Tax=Wukongibacter baidiensis TaxID=1723361 RepID=UPI003D7F34BE